jgi:hypothetical protein
MVASAVKSMGVWMDNSVGDGWMYRRTGEYVWLEIGKDGQTHGLDPSGKMSAKSFGDESSGTTGNRCRSGSIQFGCTSGVHRLSRYPGAATGRRSYASLDKASAVR